MPPALPNALRPLALLPLLALSACGGGSDEKFAPPCPTPSIPRDTSELHRFRSTGRDLTDSVLEGRIIGVNGSCTRDGDRTTVATVIAGIQLTRGPAATSRVADIAYFVAVSEGDRILDKRTFTSRAEFPPNTDVLRLGGEEVELRLPVTPTKSAVVYRISVGFQLTPAELALVRGR